MATTFPRRPALVPVPINANASITTPAQKKVGSGGKRSREDDTDDITATRSSAKRVRLDTTPPATLQIPSLKLTTATPDPLIFTKDKSKDKSGDVAGVTRSVDVVKSPKKSSRAEKERSRALKSEAEETFRIMYRAAFPFWKFYFDGVPSGAVNVATRKIEQLGGVVEGFLSKEVTHLILPVKLDKDKENDTQHNKTLSISHPHPLGTLRSPFGLKTGYNPVDRAKEWECKIWDIGKLESVLERCTAAAARPASKPEAPAATSSLQGLLTLEKAYSATSKKPTISTTNTTNTTLSVKPTTATISTKPTTSLPAKPTTTTALSLSTKSLGASATHSAKSGMAPSVPIFKPKPPMAAPFNLNSTIPLRKLPPPFHLTTTSHATASATASMAMARGRKLNPTPRLNPASRALVSLLKTEKATNTTMERDPKCQRHDYTYFSKLSAFLIVEVVHGDLQMVGRLEYKPRKTTSSAAFNHTRLISFDPRGAFNVAHRGPQGKDLPEYPLLHLDHRMRSPFAPYHPRVNQKELYLDQKERDSREARAGAIRLFRAHNRAVRANEGFMRRSGAVGELRGAKALATAAAAANHNHHVQAHEHGHDGTNGDRASGFLRSTVGGTGPCDSMSMAASGSVASFSTAFTGGSVYPPTTTSHLTTSFSLSRSGGANNWAKFHGHGHGAAGVVPSFGGVRNATQVVMNRGAFAESINAGAGAGGEARSRKTSLSRTVSLAAVPIKAEQKIAAAGTVCTTKLGDGKLRRTQSMMAIKPAKEVEPEKKKPEGYCECCKEQFDSLSEHIKSRRHRKFAVDPARYKELDRAIRKMGRVTKEQRQIDEAVRAPTRAAARERYFQRMHDLIASTQSRASGVVQPSPSTTTIHDGINESGRPPAAVASYDDPEKTLSSSSVGVDLDDLETAALVQFFEGHSGHSGSSGPPFTETDGGTVTTDTSACITPVDDLGSMAALAGETAHHTGSDAGKQKEKEIIVISSDTAAIDSSFEMALASSAGVPHLRLLDHYNPSPRNATTGKTGIRMPHRGTPMPSRIFDMGTGMGSTDPTEPESEELVLADVLRRRKNQALVAQLAQTSEREDDSDGLEILEV